MTARLKALRFDIENRMVDIRSSFTALYGTSPDLPFGIAGERAQWFASDLLNVADPQRATVVAQGLTEDLIHPMELEERAFWETPLGFTLAWWDGLSTVSPAPRRMVAMAAGGVSRQAIPQLIESGTLRVANTTITADSLSAWLQKRFTVEGVRR